jgi:hypothetical protein
MIASTTHPMRRISKLFQNRDMPTARAPTRVALGKIPITRRFSMNAAHALRSIHPTFYTAPYAFFVGIPMSWYLQTEAMECFLQMRSLLSSRMLFHIKHLFHNAANLSSIMLVCFTKGRHVVFIFSVFLLTQMTQKTQINFSSN